MATTITTTPDAERLVKQAARQAHIAALELEHDPQVVTWETDFALFAGVRRLIPNS